MFNKQELKEDIDNFFRASMSALCNCYDNTKGLYPDKCDCETRENVQKSVKLLIEEHRRLIKKYDL
jgi:hypothetical protein